MGKRSNFELQDRDLYPTIDPSAVLPLLWWARTYDPRFLSYAEPCAGDGSLIRQLVGLDCRWKSDIHPLKEGIQKLDAHNLQESHVENCDYIITNPPYSWNVLCPMLDRFPKLRPTWLLLPADMMHNKRMAPYMRRCSVALSIGRLYWRDNKIRGKDNYVWALFLNGIVGQTNFISRGWNDYGIGELQTNSDRKTTKVPAIQGERAVVERDSESLF